MWCVTRSLKVFGGGVDTPPSPTISSDENWPSSEQHLEQTVYCWALSEATDMKYNDNGFVVSDRDAQFKCIYSKMSHSTPGCEAIMLFLAAKGRHWGRDRVDI